VRARLASVPPSSPPAERFHRLRALAETWGVSEGFLRKEIARGRLRCHRFGKLVQISEQDAAAYVAARRQEGPR
jgi:excisionase family DNA binding protein